MICSISTPVWSAIDGRNCLQKWDARHAPKWSVERMRLATCADLASCSNPTTSTTFCFSWVKTSKAMEPVCSRVWLRKFQWPHLKIWLWLAGRDPMKKLLLFWKELEWKLNSHFQAFSGLPILSQNVMGYLLSLLGALLHGNLS